SSVDDKEPSFYDHVILPLVELPPFQDDVYHWLDIMFRFCAGKPCTYFSRYRPSNAIFQVAARHRVKLFHLPLDVIPQTLRDRNQYFRFMQVSREQRLKVIEAEARNRG